jgi:hypothetical protein
MNFIYKSSGALMKIFIVHTFYKKAVPLNATKALGGEE